ncbi:MAG: hypothetical protein ACE361_03255 [Aureliella sp.]
MLASAAEIFTWEATFNFHWAIRSDLVTYRLTAIQFVSDEGRGFDNGTLLIEWRNSDMECPVGITANLCLQQT